MRRETIVTVTHADARNDAFCGRDVSSRPRSSGTSGSTFTSYLSVVSIEVAFDFYVKLLAALIMSILTKDYY